VVVEKALPILLQGQQEQITPVVVEEVVFYLQRLYQE
tara:strand:+ start:688 stop:798 length:111 start_codon:yes stop_codon:yes gene_type:complete